MLGSILIGLDTPRHADALVELGIRWAKPTGATLVGLGIVDEPGIRALEPAFPIGGMPGVDPVIHRGYETRMADVRRKAEQLLERFAARCAEAEAPHEEVTAVGSPHEMIEGEAQAADLVLLARGPQFRFKATGDGGEETVKKVLKNIARPIVVAPATPAPARAIVIAYDGSLQADRALAALEATGLAGSGPVHIVGIAEASTYDTTRHVERARRFLRRHRIEATPHVLEPSGSLVRQILERVRSLEAGLLVMGAHGQPALREFLIGSVTRTALSECPVPVFLCH
jgi:nucleotide-binding universal stress UspA family protein